MLINEWRNRHAGRARFSCPDIRTRAAQRETTARAPKSFASPLSPAVYGTVLMFPWNVDSRPECLGNVGVVVPEDTRNLLHLRLHPAISAHPAGTYPLYIERKVPRRIIPSGIENQKKRQLRQPPMNVRTLKLARGYHEPTFSPLWIVVGPRNGTLTTNKTCRASRSGTPHDVHTPRQPTNSVIAQRVRGRFIINNTHTR
jgi:hypothetical protein